MLEQLAIEDETNTNSFFHFILSLIASDTCHKDQDDDDEEMTATNVDNNKRLVRIVR